MERKLIPHYNIVLNEDEDSGLEFVSFVADPAIMEMGLAFGRVSSFKFNKDKQVVVGPAMIPNVPLYRNINGEEFFVVFTEEVIDKLSEKFNKTPKEYKINVDHAQAVESAFIKSNWIIEDKSNDKSNMYGFNLPVGTWMLEVKVTDSAFWSNEIKDNGKFGFSVEGLFGLEFIGNFNKSNTNEMELTKEELAMIAKFRKGELKLELTPEEVAQVEEVVAPLVEEAVAEAVEAPVAEVEEEMAEEPVAEEAPVEEEPAPAFDEAKVQEMIDAKFDELLAMIAELKTQVESPSEEVSEEAPAAFGINEKIELVRQYRNRFND